jgi:hypothetical protein
MKIKFAFGKFCNKQAKKNLIFVGILLATEEKSRTRIRNQNVADLEH